MNKLNLLGTGLFLVGVIYLTLPSPTLPELSSSALSDEAGDTWQHPDQRGYYSNLTRSQVLSDLQSKFITKLGNLIIPSYRLNYRVEDAYELVRDQLNSNYLEEIVYPFRESLFVNGWEPKNAPRFASLAKKDVPKISLHGVVYDAKITMRPVFSAVWARLLIWILVFPSAYLVYLSFKKAFS
ncbi:hypothetical protein A3K29_03165 [Candidatus Collierbacteria bacterium RIFOXYB2_FULL_46_14]|uniref:Uncharacterized protein n=1 Tax=Candidatus Collierbacteria bacterium GW2011_GWA2_46_26 TaxID=1618381 RepID=A0A0G1SKI5_9BACT|nr:MAG: hypothetical protein UW29_C0004G0139 [Candidatus Collierbacteria bacterium GW2011_GWC2_44_13]KKU33810.1 MAG: hypothetical protein UX47_C0001G0093 [Candidatus Collierbacteria bacterium GW2011_GWA2_46_26]OGD73119.1 MAG: hypothetical protein A3K29_03165 [Candidatus Collierbacteria bacterium RIFOXYB2_FULL_46_14]OGD76161.1 MAG: hypothetical protein A3K43_03165 [Candidatus Collierbacteria bacterium RIFOXYA2_FULL_46_20]OGD77497.1 MAG: hypothetical protein A3K39_03165 [Candidatus Collierbacteri